MATAEVRGYAELPDGFVPDDGVDAPPPGFVVDETTEPKPIQGPAEDAPQEKKEEPSIWERVKKGALQLFESATPFNDVFVEKEPEPVDERANDLVRQLNNIEFRYKDLLDTYHASSGDKEAAAALSKKRMAMEDEILKLLAKQGIEGRFSSDGTLLVKGEDGRVHTVEEDGLLEGIVKSIDENAGEAGGFAAGAAAGARVGAMAPGAAKIVTVPAGAVIGGALGSAGGRDLDILRSALQIGKEIGSIDFAGAATDAAAANVAMSVVGGVAGPAVKAVGKGAVKGAKAASKMAYELPGKVLSKQKEAVKIADSELSEEAKRRALELLDFADENGIVLTANQLTDSQKLDQLTQILARSPGVRDSLKGLSQKNLDILYAKTRELLDEMAPKMEKDALDAGVADVAGQRLKDGISKALDARRGAIKKAYDQFGNAVSGKVYLDKNLLRSRLDTEDMKDFIRLSNNPEGYRAVLDTAAQKVDDLLKKNGRITAKDLDAVNKQMNSLSKNVDDPTLLDAYKKVRSELNDEIEALSAKEGNDAWEKLMKARSLHGEKEKIYGRRGEYTTFRKALDSEKTSTIVDRLLMSPDAADNALLLRQELTRIPNGKKLQKELLRTLIDRRLDDALSVTEFAKTGNIESRDLLDALTAVDDRVVRTLADEKTAKEINDIARLLKTVQKQEKLLAGTGAPMASDNTNLASAAMNWVRRIYTGSLWGKALTTPATQAMFKQMLKLSVKEAPKGGKKAAVRQMDALGKQIVKRSGGDLDAIMKEIKDARESAVKSTAKQSTKSQAAKPTVTKEEIEALRTNPPTVEEARVMERLGPQDKFATFAQDIRYIKEGRASDAQLAKYIEAKRSVDTVRFEEELAKERMPKTIEEVTAKHPGVDVDRFLKERLEADLRKEPYGFVTSKDTAKRIMDGKATPEELQRLADDLAHIEADPQWAEHYGLGKVDGDTYIAPDGETVDLNTVFANHGVRMGTGFAGGTANVFENADQDGDGVVTMDETAAAFAKGFLAGAIAPDVIKAIGKTNPKLYTRVTEILLDDTAQRSKNNLLGAFPLEQKYVHQKTGKLLESELLKEATDLPDPITSYNDFKKLFKKEDGKFYLDTPVKKVYVDANYAFRHLTNNTHYDDRVYISGAFTKTLEDPLFVVEMQYKNKPSIVFYKPFVDSDGVAHLASYAIDDKGKLVNKTFFKIDSKKKVLNMINVPDSKLLYFKGAKKE
ncbi:hypothetical protein [Hydrogenimonas sp.]